MSNIELNKKSSFVRVIDAKTQTVNFYAMTDDNTIFKRCICNSLDSYSRMVGFADYKYPYAKVVEDINRQQQAYRNLQQTPPSKDDLYKKLVLDNSFSITGDERLILNCKEKSPTTKLRYNPLSDEWFIEHHDDITFKFDKSIAKESPLLTNFYGQIENGEYLLYYLNEFRYQRQIPILCLLGFGGSGKSTVIKQFTSYKPLCCTKYFAERYTGDFGKTSLIVEEESDEKNSPNLTLNSIKDLQTTTIHSIRRMYENPCKAYGFVTILFSSNKNQHSLMSQLLNIKGEDVESIKRRMSTFNFTEANNQYIRANERGRELNELILPDGSGISTPLDAHLNYLEEKGFFKQSKFKKTTPLYLTIHSDAVEVCSRLSQNEGLLLEELYNTFIGVGTANQFVDGDVDNTTTTKIDSYQLNFSTIESVVTTDKDGNEFKRNITRQLGGIETALKQCCGKNQPGEVVAKTKIEYVAPDVFVVKRSNNTIKIFLRNKSSLIKTYNQHIGV